MLYMLPGLPLIRHPPIRYPQRKVPCQVQWMHPVPTRPLIQLLNGYQDTRPGTPSQFGSHSHKAFRTFLGSVTHVRPVFLPILCTAKRLHGNQSPRRRLEASFSYICVETFNLKGVQNAHYKAGEQRLTQHTPWKTRSMSCGAVRSQSLW